MKTIKLKNCVIKWKGDEFIGSVRTEVVNRLLLATAYVRSLAVKNVSISSKSHGPSLPGEFPHAITGRLRNSIFDDVNESTLEGVVGTNLKYGLWLEFGTRGPRTITAKNGPVLSWLNVGGIRVFARSVTIPPLLPRPYLRRSLQEAMPKIKKLFSEPFNRLRA